MVEFNRQEAIKGAIEGGQSIANINAGLSSIGQAPLSEYEQTLINRDRYGMNVAQRFGVGARDFAAGLATILGSPYVYATNENFRDTVNQNVANYAGQVARGETNVVNDFANMVLSPYGVTTEGIANNPIQSAKTGLYNAGADPFNAVLDTITLTPKGSIAKAASKLDNIPTVRPIREALLPTQREREINSILNIGDLEVGKRAARQNFKAAELANRKGIDKAVEGLTTGKWDEKYIDLTQELKAYSDEIGKELIDLGVDPTFIKNTAIGQFVLENLDPSRTKNVYLQNIQKAIENPTKENLANIGTNQKTLNELVQRGTKLYDEGKIAPITQRGLFKAGDKTLVDLTDIGKGLSTERVYGYGTTQEVASNLDRGYRQLVSEIEKAKQAQISFETLAEKFGNRINKADAAKISKNEVVISPREFKDGVKTLFNTGRQSEIGNFTKQLSQGGSPSTLKKYANDLYVVPKRDLEAFTNRVRGLDPNSTVGKISAVVKPLMGAFKSSVLVKPQYIVGNRVGNFALGSIGGADYISAYRPSLQKYLPEYLLTSTTYKGLAPVFEDVPLTTTFKDVTRELKQSANLLTNPKSTFAQRLQGAGGIVKSSQDYLARPLFQAESTLETFDRAAVYFNQAKKMAKELKVDVDTLLDRSLTDQNIQRQLIDRTNSVLGDYVGKNYYISPELHELGALSFPFYKVATTSKDVLINQLRDNPLRLQAFARNPARIGNELEQFDVTVGQQPDDRDIRGGLTVKPTYTKRFPAQKVYFDYHPLSAPFQTLSNILPTGKANEPSGISGALDMLSSNINPLTGLFNAMTGKDAWGNPVVGSNSYVVNGKVITLDNNGNPIPQKEPDVLGGFTGYLSRNFSPVATFLNQALLPTIATRSGQVYYQPTNRSILGQIGDNRIPYLMEGNPNKPILTPIENEFRVGGFRFRDSYFPYDKRVTPRDINMLMRRRGRNYRLQESRR